MKQMINWEKFEDRYVKLETGTEKLLKLSNWSDGVWFNKPGISFDVVEEDGKKATLKQLTVISKRLIRAIKPVIVRAEAKGEDSIVISILRSGEGLDTRYTVKEITGKPVEKKG
ncbi:MAG: hypothetical protein ABH879_08280 [archaeon]